MAKKKPAKSAKQKALALRSKTLKAKKNVLSGATVYLSGPMDFVASRIEAKELGWRNRIGQFLKRYGVTVYDPWYKPLAKGLGGLREGR